MPSKPASLPNLEVQPVTPDRWHDLEILFGKNGAIASTIAYRRLRVKQCADCNDAFTSAPFARENCQLKV